MRRIAIALLMLSLLTACATRPAEAPQPTTIPTVEVTTVPTTQPTTAPTAPAAISSPPVELKTSGMITVYQIRNNSDIFEAFETAIDTEEVFLADIVTAVAKQMQVTIPVLSITQQKGMVVIDLDESFIENKSKAKMVQILNSLGATMRENHRTFEWVQYQLAGEIGVFGEKWEIPLLRMLETESPEIFAAIRAQIPYEGLQPAAPVKKFTETDATAQKIAEYLAMVRIIDKDITSPQQLEKHQILQSLMYVTKWYSTYPSEADHYVPELKPFEAPAYDLLGMSEDWFWLEEHVEESARLLFGDDFVVEHGDFSHYRYLAPLGVYTPPHIGGGYNVIPVVLSYEDLGDQYRAEIVYLTEGMGGYAAPTSSNTNEAWIEVAEKDIPSFIQTAPRREVILQKAADGRLVLVSHRFL